MLGCDVAGADPDNVSEHTAIGASTAESAAERSVYRQRLEILLASRAASDQITAATLSHDSSASAALKASAAVADYADTAQAIVTRAYQPAIDCQDGCSYCCRKPGVLVTIPEVLRIVEHVRAHLDQDALARLRARAETYVRQLNGRHFNEPSAESVPCPLLVDEHCSIYPLRPLACRGYNSTSVDACRRAHADVAATVPIFAMLKDVTDGATLGAVQCLEANGFNADLVDLGTALALTLATEPVSEVSALTGRVLHDASDTSWRRRLSRLLRSTAHEVGRQIGNDVD